ncbi:chloride channel protein [Oscillatoria salina]|uniref:chloride channel protein n=1 Tax=Oscillatoria salina TaxID=331517 RepID=UPI001CD00C8C|nr:chloride channel protein [Oscillatoria salina]MBZ8183348.1 universal stress protein [Oscillatoria salina IIICB1]
MAFLKDFRTRLGLSNLARRSLDTRYALVEACGIGLISALAALLLKQGIGWVGLSRLQAANHYGAWVVLPLAGLTLGIIAGWCVETLSLAAAGGGIPQVKAALAQFPIPLSLRVALVKLFSTILVLGAGLTLGRRGPTVHIGAALAAQLSNWLPTSPEHRRQMIAAGAAAGLAAGFNTPIAGVLFVVEELMRDVSSLTLETAILASFTGAVVSRTFGSPNLDITDTLTNLPAQSNFQSTDLPFYILLGILAGLLGALFNRGILWSLAFNRRLPWAMPWRVGVAGLLSGTIIAALPDFFRNNAALREFLIAGDVGWEANAIAFVAHFCLTLIAYGSGAPGGLFAPTLVLGSALGYLVGTTEVAFLGMGSPTTYALAGMGAFFTAAIRVPVTAIVIIFEITSDFGLVLPLMVACAVAYVVGESVFSGSLYQHLLEKSGIELKEDNRDRNILAGLKATDVMERRVQTLPLDTTEEETKMAFRRSSHRGFPVMHKGKLVGIVTQADLAKEVESTPKKAVSYLGKIMTPHPITVNPKATLSDVLYLINRYQLSHLPVVENHKLVGIITRRDIIKAEAKQLSGEKNQTSYTPEPSYIIYQTRAPAVGRGRILLPLSNPKTAPALLKIAIAIAKERRYELECLCIIPVSRHKSPAQARVNTNPSRQLLAVAEKLASRQIPLHTQIRIAHDTAETILEVISQQHIDLTLMGWKGRTDTAGKIFGSVVDTIVRQAPGDVILVKLGTQANAYPNNNYTSTSWLIPIAGGPNAQRAIQLLPAFKSLTRSAYIWLCQVYPPDKPVLDTTALENTARQIRSEYKIPTMAIPIRSRSVTEAITRFANTEQCDVLMLGASREGLLQQAIQGNIPEAIARNVNSTTILVRSPLDRGEAVRD